MPKPTIKKEEPKLYKYHLTKKIIKFHGTDFYADVQSKLEEGSKVYENFEENFMGVLDAHAPRKTKFYVVIINLMLTKIFVNPL